ncbi:valine--tRNA ligase, mitochondrial-like [Colletes gigas]|uniref:valine--tRNA ligase, mitochondrial-like n=1 Tax=Colletes gigas TaxID=935657 RepID=UPI001C9A6A52|nr:valine--tRNA ligase, mitochondrial-like [Colletes gigas]
MNIVRRSDRLRINFYCKYCYYTILTKHVSDYPPVFQSKDVENGWYDVWEKNKYFTVKPSDKETLKMLLPPPNITGTLHLGHALTVTIQDILARWYRMKGHPVVWIPGLDHAGIATQLIIEKHLSKTKGIVKSDIEKEQFLSYIWEWKDQKENEIKSQLKALGASVDWSKEYFTMSKNYNDTVVEAFVTLNEKKLLYRKKNLVNWSPILQSTISDIEVDYMYIDKKTEVAVPGYKKKITFGEIAYIAYPLKDSKDKIIVATTRPETVFGDVAIAVHPDDERYGKYIGQNVWHTMRNTYIPVIADPSVDRNFGTGAVKITPAHDHLDYIIATNHQLDVIDVIDKCGNITEAGNLYEGLPRFIAREKVLNELSNRGLLQSVCDHNVSIPRCSRSRDIIEYILKEQWFVKSKSMAQKAIEAVEQNHLNIVPSIHKQTWYDWLNNIRDWCISRQLWWGHSIPAYYVTVGDKAEWIIARTESDARLIAESTYGCNLELHKDQDVLDTWFSSAIIPFAVLGWPKKTEDFKNYYPLTLMETGYDILFFWVSRMVMLGLELTGRLPFNEILLHGMLCDSHGKKMSKSIGNVISPENIINGATLDEVSIQMEENHNMGILEKKELRRMLVANKKMFPNGVPQCGVDALRVTLCSHNIKNLKIHFDVMECQANKFFCNKIWQAGRFILFMTNGREYQEPKSMSIIDRWILSQLSLMVSTVNNAIMQRDFHQAITSIREFLHYTFCDYYLEAVKHGFQSNNSEIITSHTYGTRTCFEVSLRIIAPIMPYLADDLYKRLSDKFTEFLSVPSLMEAPYPTSEEFSKWADYRLHKRFDAVLMIVSEIRSLTGGIKGIQKPMVHIVISNPDNFNFYNEVINLIKGGCRLHNICVFQKHNYMHDENSTCFQFTPDCTFVFISQDSAVLNTIKERSIKRVSNDESNLKLQDEM